MYNHFEDLQRAYFDYHRQAEGLGKGYAIRMFHGSLSRFTKYSQFDIFAQLKYGHIYSSSIVSSIEFDRDDEYFATAGVSKKIKIYEYKSIVENPAVEIHTPVKEMSCRSKISCLSWNPYIKERVACSDYEGIISVWDANTGQRINHFEEHEKRAWSVDFCHTNPTLLASGSDDSKVIIWSLNQEHSIATMDSKANVCCVKFNPESSNHIAFGSADHHIHYYDLRNVRRELATFKGHAKAVSYVRFLNADELISASTDSTLKLWSVSQNECKRSYTGHTNEKNFVGLSTCQDYIACGSENNAVFVYYKSLSKPVLTHKFATTGGAEETNDFVSSVCWKRDSGILLAANSLGTINVSVSVRVCVCVCVCMC
jgi:E3 ubiquitin-protein ligase RFWD2